MAKVDKRHRRMIREQLDAVDFFDPPKAKPKKVRQLVKIANNPTHPRSQAALDELHEVVGKSRFASIVTKGR
jgi:hypothetical protein